MNVPALVAGMIEGADSIEDMGLLRRGAMNRLVSGVRAPSTLGTFLRTFTFGHVRQLDAIASRLLTDLCTSAPLLPGAHQLSYVDDTVKPMFGYAKQGAGRGYTGVKGLNVLLGIISTPSSRPVIAAARLRKGSTNSVKGPTKYTTPSGMKISSAGSATLRSPRSRSPRSRPRGPRLDLPRQGHHRHDPGAADQRPGRLARSARRLVLHLPADWPWETPWQQMATTARDGPPFAA